MYDPKTSQDSAAHDSKLTESQRKDGSNGRTPADESAFKSGQSVNAEGKTVDANGKIVEGANLKDGVVSPAPRP